MASTRTPDSRKVAEGLRRLTPALAVLSLGLGAGRAGAAEATRVLAAGEANKPVDINVGIDFRYEGKSAAIKRELQSSLSPGRTELVKDLLFAQSRQVIDIHAEVGIYRDVWLSLALPLVISDSRTLSFDQSKGSGCVFPGDTTGRPSCVNSSNSSLLRDGIQPGIGAKSYGFDAEHNRAFSDPSKDVFRGPDRAGLEYLGAGVHWAPFNQRRDDTKPTWTIDFESRFAVGQDMRFDPANPKKNTGVGRGYHELVFGTRVSKRFRLFDPYFAAWYSHPLRDSGSPFTQYKPGSQVEINPQRVAGAMIGVEHVLWEDPAASKKVALEYRGRFEARFEGRARTEIWEALSGSSSCRTDVSRCRAGLDEDLNNDGKPDPFDGLTDVENYGVFAGDAGINVQVGPRMRFRALAGLTLEQPHFLTFADAGVDRDGDGKVATDNVKEANPVYREMLDLPGRRFRVDNTRIWGALLDAQFMW